MSARSSVSIPNGMEFYGEYFDSTPVYVSSFNSQRDGILLSPIFLLIINFVVSIPNGMEFYDSVLRLRTTSAAFQFPTGWNSTDWVLICMTLSIVSIPNGMEFYSKARDFISDSWRFQFPTGWNSTLCKLYRRNEILGFNSQRDGILPEFTRESDGASCFNSQRDGILRYARGNRIF